MAYHGVSDPRALVDQIAALRRRYQLVTGDDIARAVATGEKLPPASLWLTFDDGHPDAFAVADLLAEEGVSACMFVCPGTLDTRVPFWWQVVDHAGGAGVIAPGEQTQFSRARLKMLPDPERRAEVAVLEERLRDRLGQPLTVEQATQHDLRRWCEAGHEIGNHTWDHPCLPRCTDPEQRRQLVQAHETLVSWGIAPRFFAYPNGDLGEEAERTAQELGYVASFLFDHRLTRLDESSHRLSRLRLDASASVGRARSIASGAHSAAFGILR
ncbi:polysaccharide deacetylase family protein [Blastococcus saxobsidens]|uniref:polysaccharide deacetylase family protein n=1 Tax=Blastococcus saxobsidens TaxID=138336 RepID=UPI00140FE647|nr:polysaccharide deacetylase family protein [Blastococcus saxobsidens]